jgi:hypothetical protein
VQYGIALRTLRHLLGDAWVRRNLGPESEGASDPYLAREAEGHNRRFFFQHRVISVGNHIFELQDAAGFDDMLEALRKRSLLGAACQVEVAYRFNRAGHDVEFVKEKGIKGKDFDLLVDGSLAVEVKAKEDSTAYTKGGLKSPLDKARKQLPPGGPGVVVLRPPYYWISNPEFLAEAEDAIGEVLRGTRRINAVLITWEQWAPYRRDGRACLVMWRVFPNPAPNTPWAGLETLFSDVSPDVLHRLA